MDINEGIKELSLMFKAKDWFADVGTDQYGRLVVYTKYMCDDTINIIPDKIAGKQVLVHLIGSKTVNRDKYVETISTLRAQSIKEPIEEIIEEELPEFNVEELCLELDRLESICGPNILQDIFFELHDQDKAITNLATRYPEVYDSLEKLYNQYGFDCIYNELED